MHSDTEVTESESTKATKISIKTKNTNIDTAIVHTTKTFKSLDAKEIVGKLSITSGKRFSKDITSQTLTFVSGTESVQMSTVITVVSHQSDVPSAFVTSGKKADDETITIIVNTNTRSNVLSYVSASEKTSTQGEVDEKSESMVGYITKDQTSVEHDTHQKSEFYEIEIDTTQLKVTKSPNIITQGGDVRTSDDSSNLATKKSQKTTQIPSQINTEHSTSDRQQILDETVESSELETITTEKSTTTILIQQETTLSTLQSTERDIESTFLLTPGESSVTGSINSGSTTEGFTSEIPSETSVGMSIFDNSTTDVDVISSKDVTSTSYTDTEVLFSFVPTVIHIHIILNKIVFQASDVITDFSTPSSTRFHDNGLTNISSEQLRASFETSQNFLYEPNISNWKGRSSDPNKELGKAD